MKWKGLVAFTGWSNSGGLERPDLVHNAINACEKDLPNLQKPSGQRSHLINESKQSIGYWPSPVYLRSRTVIGSQKMGEYWSSYNPGIGIQVGWRKI